MSRRSSISGLFAKLARQDRPYFRSLSVSARWACVELTWDYWTDRCNPLTISERGLADLLGCHRNTARSVLRELCEGRFLVQERRGATSGAKKARAAIYRMTWLEIDEMPGTETFDYRKKTDPTPPASAAHEMYQQRHENWTVELVAKGASETSLNLRQSKGLRAAGTSSSEPEPQPTYSSVVSLTERNSQTSSL